MLLQCCYPWLRLSLITRAHTSPPIARDACTAEGFTDGGDHQYLQGALAELAQLSWSRY